MTCRRKRNDEAALGGFAISYASPPGRTRKYGLRSMGVVAEHGYARIGSTFFGVEGAQLGGAITKEGG